jgi:hypothetical protein
MIAIPKLRNRLNHRFQRLKTAWMQPELEPITLAGANENPFPKEYERAPVQNNNKLQSSVIANPVASNKTPVLESSLFKSVRILPSAKSKASISSISADNNLSENEANSQEASPDSLPQYRQGKNEKEAYDLVLKANKTLAMMVQGGNPGLQWKSWGAAHRGEDCYWVRVVFLNNDKTEIEYIWQVKIASGEISPLSYNARAIS